MDSALNRESATAKVASLINCLYNKNEQVGMNLTGTSSKNQPRKAMDTDIRDSIIGMVSIMILEILFCMKLEITSYDLLTEASSCLIYKHQIYFFRNFRDSSN